MVYVCDCSCSVVVDVDVAVVIKCCILRAVKMLRWGGDVGRPLIKSASDLLCAHDQYILLLLCYYATMNSVLPVYSWNKCYSDTDIQRQSCPGHLALK